jgi:transaldolase
MDKDLEQKAMDAYWEECQAEAKRHEREEQAVAKLVRLCRELADAYERDELPVKLPSTANAIRAALAELDENEVS